MRQNQILAVFEHDASLRLAMAEELGADASEVLLTVERMSGSINVAWNGLVGHTAAPDLFAIGAPIEEIAERVLRPLAAFMIRRAASQ